MPTGEEDERADAAVLGHDPVVIREQEGRHRRLETKLGRDLLQDFLEQLELVEARSEPPVAVDHEVLHRGPP